MTPSIFTISLDFELHWGVFDKRDRASRLTCYRKTKELIPRLLDLFARHEIGVTWATVGSLFVEDEAEWRRNLPAIIPAYDNPRYSQFKYVQEAGVSGENAVAHFAPDLVRLIAQYPGQELATHTFSHYYCLEKGQQIDAFAADLSVVQKLALEKTGQTLTSLVFPRNQFNEDYLKVCFAHGINVIRANPKNWYWTGIGDEETSFMRRVFRTGDVFIPLGSRNSYSLAQIEYQPGLPLCLPASRLLRQYDPAMPMLNVRRLQRIMGEMTNAAARAECYHLWWHPENFGFSPEECMQELRLLLDHYDRLKQEFDLVSLSMRNVEKIRKDSIINTTNGKH